MSFGRDVLRRDVQRSAVADTGTHLQFIYCEMLLQHLGMSLVGS